MALRMLLVGVVACLGLNQPPVLRGNEAAGSIGGTLGVGVLGALVEASPIAPASVVADPIVEGPAPAPRLAASFALLDWSAALIGLAEPAQEIEGRAFACTVGEAGCVAASVIEEVVEAEPTVVAEIEPAAAADPDAAFLAALDDMVGDFERDALAMATPEPEPEFAPAPAPEAEIVLGDAAISDGPILEPEPLYPGLAYELNREHEGLGQGGPIGGRIDLAKEVPGEAREERVADAVRLTGQAIQAWARIFVHTGPVRR
jgi:hypothetical protein